MNAEEDRAKWHEATVSWGQFLVALAVAVGTLVAFILNNEHRLTSAEENDKSFERRIGQLQVADSLIMQRLEAIQASSNNILIELAKHQAQQDAIDDAHAGHPGVKAPRR